MAPAILAFKENLTGTISRPGSDVSVSNWVFTGSSLSGSINESVRDDTSYAQVDYGSADAITTLDISRTPGNHVISFSGEYLASLASSGQFRFSLLDSSNAVLGSTAWQAVSSSNAQYDLPVTITGTATRIKIEKQA
jgi:hypothetical protein